jgi:hypothetical protein
MTLLIALHHKNNTSIKMELKEGKTFVCSKLTQPKHLRSLQHPSTQNPMIGNLHPKPCLRETNTYISKVFCPIFIGLSFSMPIDKNPLFL